MYRIGHFSKINRVSIKTLRYYDETGLLKPAFVDEENNYRYYTTEQLMDVQKIISLRQIGFSINEIKKILDGENMEGIFEQRKMELMYDIVESKTQLQKINTYLNQLKGGLFMEYQVAIKELPEVIVYSKKINVKNYDEFFDVIPKIGEEIKKANPDLKTLIPEYCFHIYSSGEYKEEDIDLEFCEAVTEFGKNSGDIVFKKVPTVKEAATVFHKGPYSSLGQTYAFLFKWIEDNGYKAVESPRESFIDGIWNKKDESQWLTELQIPVGK